MGWQSLGFDSCVVVSPKSVVLGLVHSNVFIALSATSVAVTTTLLAGFPLAVGPLFIVFAATLFVYNLNRITDMSEDATNVPGRVEFVRTVPVLFGPRATRVLTQTGNALAGAGVVALVAAGVLSPEYLVVLAVQFYVGAYIPFATPGRTPLFYGFVVDGEHVFLAALVALLELLPCLL